MVKIIRYKNVNTQNNAMAFAKLNIICSSKLVKIRTRNQKIGVYKLSHWV